jgi:hypothetical protein
MSANVMFLSVTSPKKRAVIENIRDITDYYFDDCVPREGLQEFVDGVSSVASVARVKAVRTMALGGALEPSRIVSGIEFDKDNEYFATAGVRLCFFVCLMCHRFAATSDEPPTPHPVTPPLPLGHEAHSYLRHQSTSIRLRSPPPSHSRHFIPSKDLVSTPRDQIQCPDPRTAPSPSAPSSGPTSPRPTTRASSRCGTSPPAAAWRSLRSTRRGFGRCNSRRLS